MRTFLTLATFLLASFLSGCGSSVERAVFGDGTDGFARKTLHAHVFASVANDETPSSFAMGNFDRAAGVGDAERAYRRVTLLILVDEGRPPLFGKVGMRGSMALVPDGTPMLRKGDIVEVRTASQYDGLKGFARTGEGAAVVKVHCMGGSKPGNEEQVRFKRCASRLPWIEAWGEEHRYYAGILAKMPDTPYLPSLKDYPHLSFQPFYGPDLKPLASRVLPAQRVEPQ